MANNNFEKSWSGWKPKAVTEHEYRQILLLSTPTQRLEWLCSMLTSLEKNKVKKIK